MPVAGAGIGFWISGPPIEPADDPAWHLASEGLRRKFWGQVKGLAQEVYAAEREAGIGADGRRLARLSKRTIAHRRSEMGPADPAAPPLIPAHGLSRTISLLTGQVTDRGIWFRWKSWHRQSWGQVLLWHARGQVQGAPARDVMGISPQGLQRLAQQARKWWEANRPLAYFAPQPAGTITPTPKTPLPTGWQNSRIVNRNGRGHLEHLTARVNLPEGSVSTGWRQFRPTPPPRPIVPVIPRPVPPRLPTPVAATESLVVKPAKPAEAPAAALTGRVRTAALLIGAGQPGRIVRLADLRAALPDVPRPDLDALLRTLAESGRIVLRNFDDPLSITPADRAAAFLTPSGEVRHYLILR